MKYKKIDSSDNNVSKFVFEKSDIAVEAVLYRYNSYKERTVICCSTQCGCPVGCSFCGTGKFFIRQLTYEEIVEQVEIVLSTIDCDPSEIKKFQIMFMSMGEPFMNFDEVDTAMFVLHEKYPNADLLISTSAPAMLTRHWSDFITISNFIPKIGVQFSIHESNDEARKLLIPKGRTLPLQLIGQLGEEWALATNRNPFFNYCVHEGNSSDTNVKELLTNFNPNIWEVTLSVICEKDETMSNAIDAKLDLIKSFSDKMIKAGYSIRIFNPAGQDDIGGGCGQLWYFQEWLNDKKHIL